MARHKKIAHFKPNWDDVNYDVGIFMELRKRGYVQKTYEYSKRKIEAGDIFLAKEAGEQFISIASNEERRYTDYHIRQCRSTRRTYRYFRIMYRLTNEGWSYLKKQAVKQALGV